MVVADISEESANETMHSLQGAHRGQAHMAAVVDVSSKQSVKKLVTQIQVCKESGRRVFFCPSLTVAVSLCRLITSSLHQCV